VFVALIIQHATRVRHIISSSVGWLAVSKVFSLSHTRHHFGGKVRRSYWTQNVCFEIHLQLFSPKYFSFWEDFS